MRQWMRRLPGAERLLISAAASANASRAFRVGDCCPLAVLISLFSPDMLVSSSPLRVPCPPGPLVLPSARREGDCGFAGCAAVDRRTTSPGLKFFFFLQGVSGAGHCGGLTTCLNSSAKVRRGSLQRPQHRAQIENGLNSSLLALGGLGLQQ